MERWAEDLATVMDAAGMDRAVIVGAQDGGHVAQLFAATHPERTTALVLMNGVARVPTEPGHSGPTQGQEQELVAAIDEWWGSTVYFRRTAPSLAADRELLKRLARQVRHQASPGTAQAVLSLLIEIDTTAVLPAIRVPTMVLHASEDPWHGVEQGRLLGERILGAELRVIPARDHLWWSDNPDGFLDEIEEFVTGVRRGADPDRILATVLFTDIVASTERAASVGDRRWREVLEAHDELVRRELDRHRGREVNTTGDGFVASFDGPARAIRCAVAIVRAAQGMGIDVRAGIHTGECEVRGLDLGGLAVHIAARVGGEAGVAEVLVSQTVKDLVIGSGLEFRDKGEQELKGVPGLWRLFAVAD
jgi:class 3 adenylate cyclase